MRGAPSAKPPVPPGRAAGALHPPVPHLLRGTQLSQQPGQDCTHQGSLEIKQFLKPEQKKSPAPWAALQHATTETTPSGNEKQRNGVGKCYLRI